MLTTARPSVECRHLLEGLRHIAADPSLPPGAVFAALRVRPWLPLSPPVVEAAREMLGLGDGVAVGTVEDVAAHVRRTAAALRFSNSMEVSFPIALVSR